MAPESKLDRVASYRDIESLKELLLSRFQSHDTIHNLMDQTRVETKAEMERRLQDMNNLRHQIEQAEARFTTRSEWQAGHEAVYRTVAANDQRMTEAMSEHSTMVDVRFRTLERFIWMACGAVALLATILRWIK
jgi:hypothetical protein